MKVYDATIAFAGLSDSDIIPPEQEEESGYAAEGEAGGLGPQAAPRKPIIPRPPLPDENRKGILMEGERVVFTEEANPQRYVKLVAAGEIDETLLDAIAEYVERQRKRLERASSALSPETSQRRRLREEEEQE